MSLKFQGGSSFTSLVFQGGSSFMSLVLQGGSIFFNVSPVLVHHIDVRRVGVLLGRLICARINESRTRINHEMFFYLQSTLLLQLFVNDITKE